MEKNDIDQNNNSNNPNANEIIKLIIIGSVSVGKTSLLLRYATGKFQNVSKSTSTASYITKIKQANNKTYEIRLWDTAGQEKYKALTKFFYKDAAICILVYDICRRNSFDSIKNYWYPQVRENVGENIVLGIAGNKCDLYEKEEIKEEEVREWANEIGAVFELTSAQSNTGINELFENLGYKFIDPNFKPARIEEKREKSIVINKNDLKKNETKTKKSFC